MSHAPNLIPLQAGGSFIALCHLSGHVLCWTSPLLLLTLFIHFVTLQYEPELFPGLIYRMKEPKIVLLIFVSGKVVLTGARDLVRCCSDTLA